MRSIEESVPVILAGHQAGSGRQDQQSPQVGDSWLDGEIRIKYRTAGLGSAEVSESPGCHAEAN